MAKPDPDLDRLLRAAAKHEPAPAEMPFGFDTRIVALAREQRRGSETNGGREFTRFLRRVALLSIFITAFASSAAYWQLSETEAAAEPLSNAYAIADNAIDAEFFE